MIEVLHTKDGDIKAVCEWYLVNEKGEWDAKGKFVWINEVEVSPQYRNNGCLRSFIKIVTDKVPSAEYGYFWRQSKYPDRKPKIYSRRQWLSLIKED